MDLPSFADVLRAAGRLHGRVRRTSVLSATGIDGLINRRVYFKCENQQHGGAFKYRGALNALLQTPVDARSRLAATHSSGNHGLALSLAAQSLGRSAVVVMPENSSASKLAAVRASGAELLLCAPGIAAREAALSALAAARPLQIVHPFDDVQVIAGQGTAALELISECGDLDLIVTPVGGGGLIGGTALAARALLPDCRIVAAEPAAADDAYRSLRSGRRENVGNPETIADGLRASIGQRNFELLRQLVDEVVRVEERQIIRAMRVALDELKLLIEPSAAVALAAVLAGTLGSPGDRIGVVLSGGNVDLDQCPFLSGAA